MEQAKNEMLVVSGLCDQHIFNKEKKQMKYEAYMEEYVDLVKRFTEAQDKYKKLMAEQVDRNRQSIKLQAFINEIKATDTLNLEFNDKLFNLTIINIKVYKDSHLEFNFKDGSVINIVEYDKNMEHNKGVEVTVIYPKGEVSTIFPPKNQSGGRKK